MGNFKGTLIDPKTIQKKNEFKKQSSGQIPTNVTFEPIKGLIESGQSYGTPTYPTYTGDGGNGTFNLQAPTYQKPIQANGAQLRTINELAKAYGINYNYNQIYDMFKNSVEAQYKTIYQKQRDNEAKYYDNTATAQNTLLDTLDAQRSAAVTSGMNRGMQAANILSAALGVSQQFADNATTLAQQRSEIAADYGAARAKARTDASAEAYNRKNALLEIAKVLYGTDADQYASQLGYNANIGTNNAALYNTYTTNLTNRANTLTEAAVQRAAANASVAASINAANAQKYAADRSYNANIYAANKNNEAQKAYYDAQSAQYNLQSSNLLTWEQVQEMINNGDIVVKKNSNSSNKSSKTVSRDYPKGYTVAPPHPTPTPTPTPSKK